MVEAKEVEAVEAKEVEGVECENLESKNTISRSRRLDRTLLKRFEGKTIGEIEIQVNKIFDETKPKENNALYRLANRLQVNTREQVIRSQLLFAPGEPLDVTVLEESLRILYGREYLLDVDLKLLRSCGDKVDLKVSVRDAWVMEPKLSYGRQGGENSSSIGLRDGNFLGSGSEVALIYQRDAERNKIVYRYRTEHFLGQRLTADFYHADLSDGSNRSLLLEKPFYSVNTRWSYGVESSETKLLNKIRFNDEVLNEFSQTTSLDSAFVGHAVNVQDDHTHRVKVGVSDQNNTFEEELATERLPEDERQRYTWVEFEKVTNQYEQYINLNYIGRTEDVAIGTTYAVRLGLGEFGHGDALYRGFGRFSKILGLSQNHLFQINLDADLIYNVDQSSYSDSIIGVSANYNYFINDRHRWYYSLSYDWGDQLAEYRQLTIGETDGMRGYPLAYQRGDKRYIAHIERRFYSDLHWFNLIRVGMVMFLDFGGAWGADDFRDTHHLQSVGLGLRLHSSKTGNPAVMHINIGTPLSEKEGIEDYLISLSLEAVF